MGDAGFDMYADYKVAPMTSGAIKGCVLSMHRNIVQLTF